MNSKIINGITPGGKRTVLAEVLPLNTPFLVQIFPVYNCNFRCNYCLHALPRNKHGYISDKVFMDINMYKKCIDDMSNFKNKLKMLRFAGIGEPLLHKEISEMIRYAKRKNVADSTDIVTNGALLNPDLSLSLIDAGLDKLRISIQGVSAESYSSVSNVKINFDKLVENIKFFYENRGRTNVYIKIIDCAFNNETEEQKFFDIFGGICDTIAIEHLTPTVKEINYEKLSKGKKLDMTQSGNSIMDSNICPQPFYMMQVNPDGAVVPCCSMTYPKTLGNVTEQCIESIWNDDEFNNFRRQLLNGVQEAGSTCSQCSLYKYGLFKEDTLDEYAENLKKLY
ncbi:radical SAM/SPASM domain-containing protein [Clostridium cylindrosporum]|uniref:Radical SAM domain protein n=1 Tax=Clostridium cylindrosporum DSM 605 TaxID=1121307 RepID=A0A0J8DEM3_CLOCY|nr:radical SAM protein [Clostridium cylindrosporum]KMT22633.1 radical SAM domain protein [Clostridium cylindrosporum DSM 605]